MPGTISSVGCSRAASVAGPTASTESWSVTASTRTPRRTASRTSSAGVYVPSAATVWVWRSIPPTGRPPLPPPGGGEHVLDESAGPEADAALRGVRQLLVRERHARDVEVDPRRVARELPDEEPGGDGAAGPRPGVAEVRHLAAQPLAVLVDERQRPEALASSRARRNDPRLQRAVVRHCARAEAAERDRGRSGQGGDVDDLVRLDLLAGVDDRVGQGQAALGVGVIDLDRLAI